jgi:serine/threonine-protein kinase
VRVIIADDEVLFREGVARLLADAGVEVVDTVGTAEALPRAVRLRSPDVVLLDIKMPPTHTDEGLVAAKEVRASHPGVGVVLLSHYLDARYAMDLLASHPEGVGYLLKERVSDVAVLVDALRRVTEMECVIDPTIASRLVRRATRNDALGALTERERDVLGLMAEGRSNAAICAALFLSSSSVEAHIRQVFAKLGLQESQTDNRRVLAVLAFLRAH